MNECRFMNCELTCMENFLHWMKHKAIQYFHTFFFFPRCVTILFYKHLLRMCEQGYKQNPLGPFESLMFVKVEVWAARGRERGRDV